MSLNRNGQSAEVHRIRHGAASINSRAWLWSESLFLHSMLQVPRVADSSTFPCVQFVISQFADIRKWHFQMCFQMWETCFCVSEQTAREIRFLYLKSNNEVGTSATLNWFCVKNGPIGKCSQWPWFCSLRKRIAATPGKKKKQFKKHLTN